MSIQDYFTDDFIVRRLRTVTGSKKSFQATATVEGHLQTQERKKQTLEGIIEYREIIWYTDLDATIKLGDKITDKYGQEYIVKDFSRKDYGTYQHLEVILNQVNE